MDTSGWGEKPLGYTEKTTLSHLNPYTIEY